MLVETQTVRIGEDVGLIEWLKVVEDALSKVEGKYDLISRD